MATEIDLSERRGERRKGRSKASLAIAVVIAAALSGMAAAARPPAAGLSLSIGDRAYRDCVFDRAGVARQVRGLDQLDLDMMFLAAARDTPADFIARDTKSDPPRSFARLLSRRQAASLQRLTKAHAVCRTRSGQALQPWPLAAEPVR